MPAASVSFPRHRRNNSTGSVSTAGMCSFGSFDFAGHFSGDFSVGGEDSIVSEFERMCGNTTKGGNNTTNNGNVAATTTTKTNGAAAAAAAASNLVLPSPTSDNAGPMRRRLGATDSLLEASSPEDRALNLPFTPGSGAGSRNRGRGEGGGGGVGNRYTTPSPSQIGEIIVGGGSATSPATSLGVSTLGGGSTSATPISQTTMRDLLDTLNSLEDDGSSFGGSIGQSTISTKSTRRFQAPAETKSVSSRPPRALNIPARSINKQRDGPNGIPRPSGGRSGSTGSRPAGVSSSSMPPMQKRDVPPRNPRSSTTSRKNGKGTTNGLHIPTFDNELQAERERMVTEEGVRAQTQSVLPNKENAAPSKLPPMNKGTNRGSNRNNGNGAANANKTVKQNSRPKLKSVSHNSGTAKNGAFPSFNNGSADENAAPNNKAGNKPLVRPHSRVTSTKIYSRTLPSVQKPGAVLPGASSSISTVGTELGFGERKINFPTLAEF